MRGAFPCRHVWQLRSFAQPRERFRAVNLMQLRQQALCGRLADQEIGIVLKLARAVRGNAKALRQSQQHQIEQHRDFGCFQREDAGVAARDGGHGRQRIGPVKRGIGQGNGKLVDLTTIGHIAEIDQPRNLLPFDQHVVIVRVLIEHRLTQRRKPFGQRSKGALLQFVDQRPTCGVGDLFAPRQGRLGIIQVPEKIGLPGRRMKEALQGFRQLPQPFA